MFLLFATSCIAIQQFILDENPHFYSFECDTPLVLGVKPAEKMHFVLYSSKQGLKVSQHDFVSGENASVSLGNPTTKEDYFVYTFRFADADSCELKFECPAQTEKLSIVLRAEQDVPSDGTLYFMIYLAIFAVFVVICIILLQFCTFHHRKQD